MIVPNENNKNNDNWHNARIADIDNELVFQQLEQQFAWEDGGNDDWNGNLNEQPVGRNQGEDLGPHPLDGLPWDHPNVLAELARNVLAELNREAEENEAAQELYELQVLDADFTVPAGDDEDCDPRIEHVPALSRQHGDQTCELALDGMHIIFYKKNDDNSTEETIEFLEGFQGRKCRFFDAAGTLCVMVFEADGVNTLIYDFFTGQILGGGPIPEAIDWSTDTLRKVSLIEGEGLQVVVTNEADGIRNIMIGV
jgi:hypothetical protein